MTIVERSSPAASHDATAAKDLRTPILDLRRVSKSFGIGPPAVNSVNLTVYPGEFFSLLGPSGCGKTTIPRMPAGFEAPVALSWRIGDITLLWK